VRLWPAGGGEPRVREGHAGEVSALALWRGGLVSVGREGRVVTWDLAGGAPPLALETGDELKHVVATPDGRYLAWGGRGGAVTLADRDRGITRSLGNLGGVVRAMIFSPDGAVLAAGGDSRTVALWSTVAGERATLSGHAAAVRGLAVSADGATLASASDDGTVRLWPLRVPFGASAVAIGAGQGWLAAIGRDHAIRARRLPDGPIILLEGHTDGIYGTCFTGDGRLVSASRDRTVRAWDLERRSSLRLLTGARAVEVGCAGTRVAAGTADGALHLWELDGDRSTRHAAHEGTVEALVVAPGGGELATGGEDGMVRLWRWDGTARTLATLGARVVVLRFAPDGTRLYAGAADGTVHELRPPDGGHATIAAHQGEVTALAVSPDGSLVASGGTDRAVRLRDAAGDRLLGHAGAAVVALAFTPDGKQLVSAGRDGVALAWPLDGGAPRLLARAHGPALDAALVGGVLAMVTDEDGLRLVPLDPPSPAGVAAALPRLTRATLEADVLGQPWRATPAGR
jgi:WD40 repeat protein